MPLTPSQKHKVAELREISKIACIDFWNVESGNDDNSVKHVVLDLAKDRIIRADVVFLYVLIGRAALRLNLPALLRNEQNAWSIMAERVEDRRYNFADEYDS